MSRSVSPTPSMHPSRPGVSPLSFATSGYMSDMIGNVSPSHISESDKIKHFPQSQTTRQRRVLSSGKRWSVKEDEVLFELGDEGEPFKAISERLPGRSKNACRVRYQGVRSWTRDYWSEAEEQTLAAMMQAGASYQQAANQLQGETATECKDHWDYLKTMAREQLSREEYVMFLPLSYSHENHHEDRFENEDMDNEAPDSGLRHDVPSAGVASGRWWTYRENKVLHSLRARGKTWTEISRRLPGRSPSACMKYHLKSQNPRTSGSIHISRIRQIGVGQDLNNGAWRSEDETADFLTVNNPKEKAFSRTPADNTDTESGMLSGTDLVDRLAQAKDNESELGPGRRIRNMKSTDIGPFQDSTATSAKDRPWTDREIKAILYLRKRGKTFEEISAHLTERTPKACEMRYFWCLHLRKNAIKGTPTMSIAPAMQKSKTQAWRFEDEGLDMLTGLCSGADGSDVGFRHVANDRNSHTSGMEGCSDDGESEYFSINSDDTNTIRHESSDPTTNDENEEDVFYTLQSHAIPTPQLVSLAQRVLHQHLVAQGEEKVKRNALQQGRRTQSAQDNHKAPATQKLVDDRNRTLQHHESIQSRDIPPIRLPTQEQEQEQEKETAKARHDALEHLKRMYPPQATHGSTTRIPSLRPYPSASNAARRPRHGHSIPRAEFSDIGAHQLQRAAYGDDRVRERVLWEEDRLLYKLRAGKDALGGGSRDVEMLDGESSRVGEHEKRVEGKVDGKVNETILLSGGSDEESESDEEDIEGVYKKWGIS